MKIFKKFCKCLKINAKFWEGFAILGKLHLWNFYVKYYKTFIQKFEAKGKKNTTLSYRAHASTMLSVLYLHLLVLVPYFATCGAPFARICELSMKKVIDSIDNFFLNW